MGQQAAAIARGVERAFSQEKFEGRFISLRSRYITAKQTLLLGDAISRIESVARSMDVPGPLGVDKAEVVYLKTAMAELLSMYLCRKEPELVEQTFARLSIPPEELVPLTKSQMLSLPVDSLVSAMLNQEGKRGEKVSERKEPRKLEGGGTKETLQLPKEREKPISKEVNETWRAPKGGCFICGGPHFQSVCPKKADGKEEEKRVVVKKER